VQPTS